MGLFLQKDQNFIEESDIILHPERDLQVSSSLHIEKIHHWLFAISLQMRGKSRRERGLIKFARIVRGRVYFLGNYDERTWVDGAFVFLEWDYCQVGFLLNLNQGEQYQEVVVEVIDWVNNLDKLMEVIELVSSSPSESLMLHDFDIAQVEPLLQIVQFVLNMRGLNELKLIDSS